GINTVKICEFINAFSPWNPSLVNFVCIDDNFRACCLAEDFGQTHSGNLPRIDDISQHSTRADRGQLIDIADNKQRRMGGNGLEQLICQHHIHHGSLINDEHIKLKRIILVVLEGKELRVKG